MCEKPSPDTHICKGNSNGIAQIAYMKFTYAFLAVFYQAGTNCINFQHYVHLYEAEKDSHLKIVPKFTSSHVKPSKLEKMNVRLATQVPNRCRTFSFYSSFLNANT